MTGIFATPNVLPEMRPLSGGTFLMGSEHGLPDERPVHEVALAPFRAAVAPVTNAEYARFAAATGVAPAPFAHEERFSQPGLPAVGISWFDAVQYCKWLGAETGIPFRLPTEAEREFAARGGLTGDWPWPAGAHPRDDLIAAMPGPHKPLPECANAYGLFCMAENVHEWCSDWYAAGYYAVSPAEAPAGPPTGARRASRGGSWRHRLKTTRVPARSSIPPEFRYSDYGFRVYADA